MKVERILLTDTIRYTSIFTCFHKKSLGSDEKNLFLKKLTLNLYFFYLRSWQKYIPRGQSCNVIKNLYRVPVTNYLPDGKRRGPKVPRADYLYQPWLPGHLTTEINIQVF